MYVTKKHREKVANSDEVVLIPPASLSGATEEKDKPGAPSRALRRTNETSAPES